MFGKSVTLKSQRRTEVSGGQASNIDCSRVSGYIAGHQRGGGNTVMHSMQFKHTVWAIIMDASTFGCPGVNLSIHRE